MHHNLRKVAAIGTQLCLEACHIIKQSYQNKDLKRYMKDIDDPVTQADYKVQTMIINGFGMHFPNLRIIGQQTSQYKQNIDVDYSKISSDEKKFLPSYVGLEEQLTYQQTNSSCLWIDPLDCTRGFISGNIEDVTVLIGMSVNKKAHLGIVGTPFKRRGGKVYYDPSVTIGSVGCQQTYQYSPFDKVGWKQLKKKSLKQLAKQRGSQQIKIATSSKRQNNKQNHIIQSFNAINIKVGGCGRKIIMVVKQQADLMMFIDSPTSLWDSCAGQALIKSMNGGFMTPSGKQLVYDKNAKQTLNRAGMICALDSSIFQRATNLLEQMGIYKQKPEQTSEIEIQKEITMKPANFNDIEIINYSNNKVKKQETLKTTRCKAKQDSKVLTKMKEKQQISLKKSNQINKNGNEHVSIRQSLQQKRSKQNCETQNKQGSVYRNYVGQGYGEFHVDPIF